MNIGLSIDIGVLRSPAGTVRSGALDWLKRMDADAAVFVVCPKSGDMECRWVARNLPMAVVCTQRPVPGTYHVGEMDLIRNAGFDTTLGTLVMDCVLIQFTEATCEDIMR